MKRFFSLITLLVISLLSNAQNKLATYRKFLPGTWETSTGSQKLTFTKQGICIMQFGNSSPDTSTYEVNLDPEINNYRIYTKSIHNKKAITQFMIRKLTNSKLDVWIMGFEPGAGVYKKKMPSAISKK